MSVSGDLSRVSAVDPGDTVLHVLHVTLGAPGGRLLRSVAHQRGLGWHVEVSGPGRLRLPAQLDATDVVVLHGRRAGWLGRVLLRGRRATALAPHPGQWAPRGVPLLVERLLAGWADVVMVDPSDVRTGARVWVPPFEVDSDDVQAAVLMRCHAYGRPSAGLGQT